MLTKISDGNGGSKWIVKRKFGLALFSLLFGYVIFVWMLLRVTKEFTVADIATIMASLTTYTLGVLGPVYAADIADKKLNGGKYNQGEQ